MTTKTKKDILSILFIMSIASLIVRFPMLQKKALVEETSKIDTFQNINIQAKSAYVFDIKTGEVLFNLNEDVQLPLASITKVMSAIVAKENAPEGLQVRTAEKLLSDPGGGDIRSGEWWELDDLAKFSLVASSNDGARALAVAIGKRQSAPDKNPEEIFIDKMNQRALELGLNQTYFLNSYGLDVSNSFSGAYGSAKDSAKLIAYAYMTIPEIMESTSYPLFSVESVSGIIHNIENTNEIADELPGLSASKTGFTDLAGGNLAIVFEAGPNHPIALALLGSSKDGRFDDMKKLYKASLEYIRLNN